MTRAPLDIVLQQVRTLTVRQQPQGTDADLLGQFITHQDESAFEALLGRHGPMVLQIARRILGSPTDAEDVFQATFLLLARKAGSIHRRSSLASWLHGVTHRLALHARSERIRRQIKESQAAGRPQAESRLQTAWSDLEAILDEVLQQLPPKYRTPLVCCYLEGRTQEEVAALLGAPLGTVRSWLLRGRELLRQRLVRRGVTLSVPGLEAALLAIAAAPACGLPAALAAATMKALPPFAAGLGPFDTVSPAVSALIREGMATMVLTKLKSKAACLLLLVLLATGTGLLAQKEAGGPLPAPTVATNPTNEVPQEPERGVDLHGDPLPPEALARLGTVRFRHEDWIGPLALSPDGRELAAVAGKSLIVWDAGTGQPRQRITMATALPCLAFHPDGKSMVVGGADHIVRLLDLASGKEVRRFLGHKAGKGNRWLDRGVTDAVFAVDGKTLLSWGSDHPRLWDVASGKECPLPSKDWTVRGLSPDGKLLAGQVKGSEKVLRLWDVMDQKEVRQMSHHDEVRRLSFSPDGKFLAVEVKGTPKILWLWDVTTGKEVRQFAHVDSVGHLAFSPDSKAIAAVFGSLEDPNKLSRIAFWDLSSGKELATLAGHEAAIFALAFSPDGKTLASGGYDKTVRLWDLATAKELHRSPPLSTPVYQLVFSRDGQTLFFRGAENQVRLWNVLAWRDQRPADGPSQAVEELAFSPEGKRVAASSRGSIRLWEATTGKPLLTLERAWSGVPLLAFSADGNRLTTGAAKGAAQVWGLGTGKELRRLPGRADHPVELMALSPDGTTLAAWGDKPDRIIVLRHAGTGKEMGTLEVPAEQPGVLTTLQSLCFSRDGKTLYGGSGTHLAVLRWDVPTGKELPPLGKHDGGINWLALSPDDRSLAVVTMGESLYLWELATGQTRLVTKDAGHATAVAFSPDGRLLALADNSRHNHSQGPDSVSVPVGLATRDQVRLVRVADGKVIRRFTGHAGGVTSLCFSPDGRTLASGGNDTTSILWRVPDRSATELKEDRPLKVEELADLWTGLGGEAAEAHRRMARLLAVPAQAVRLFHERLKPVVPADPERVAALVKKLDSDQFNDREAAARELKEFADAAEPLLPKRLKDNLPAETRRRLEAILDDLGPSGLSPERLRALRAIEVLERIADRDARDLLKQLAEGAAGAWLTEEARGAMQRLQGGRP